MMVPRVRKLPLAARTERVCTRENDHHTACRCGYTSGEPSPRTASCGLIQCMQCARSTYRRNAGTASAQSGFKRQNTRSDQKDDNGPGATPPGVPTDEQHCTVPNAVLKQERKATGTAANEALNWCQPQAAANRGRSLRNGKGPEKRIATRGERSAAVPPRRTRDRLGDEVAPRDDMKPHRCGRCDSALQTLWVIM